jgi:hypothetical protein
MAKVDRTREEVIALGDDIAEHAAHIDAATHALLTKLREFDRCDGWFRAGALTFAHWLSWRVGMGRGAAREKIRVAMRLAELPLIDAAMARGELSYSKVRAMTRVATADNEAMLVLFASKMTASQLEKTCRRLRQAQSLEGVDPSEVEDGRRWVETRQTDDGMVSIQIRVMPEEAARVMKAIEHCADGPSLRRRRGCPVGTGGRSLADGAVALAEAALAGSPGEGSIRTPVEVVVHVTAADLIGETPQGDRISAEASRRLLCDAGVVPLLEDAAGKTIDVGRKSRSVPAALRRALEHRDGGCRFPGCSNTRWVDAHHVDHWIDGGETSLTNTVLLCRRHHRYLHEYGYSMELVDGAATFRDAEGKVIPPCPPRPPLTRAGLAAMRAERPTITSRTNEPGWDGQPVHYEWCVDALAG